MKRWQIITLVVVLLTIVVVASIRSSGPRGEKVYAEKATRRNIESIVSASGEVDPKLKVNISAHVIGKIEKLYFKEGDVVQKGQRLVDLERATYVAERDRRQAEVANRHIEVRRARAALKNAELQYRRAQQMQQQGIQAQELFDRAALEYETARTALASAEEGVRQATAARTQSDEDLKRTTLLAPITGKVVQLSAQEGEFVVTGTMNNPGSVIAVLADLSEVIVEADVAETEVVRVKLEQPARVRVDAVPDHEYTGRVVEIGSSAMTKQGTSGIRYFAVKIAITNPDDRLRPGMTSQVDVVTESRAQVLSVPVQSVVERSSKKRKASDESEDDSVPKKKYVFVIDGEKVKMTEVTTGLSSDTYVAVVSGLKEGEEVVTGPFRLLKKLQDGDTVRVEKEKKSSGESESDADSDKDKE